MTKKRKSRLVSNGESLARMDRMVEVLDKWMEGGRWKKGGCIAVGRECINDAGLLAKVVSELLHRGENHYWDAETRTAAPKSARELLYYVQGLKLVDD